MLKLIWVLSISFVLFTTKFGYKRMLRPLQFWVYCGKVWVFWVLFFGYIGIPLLPPPPPPLYGFGGRHLELIGDLNLHGLFATFDGYSLGQIR